MLTLDTCLRPSARCAYQTMGDQTLVVLPHRRRQHFLKNETATWIWSRLAAETPLARIADEMVARYNASPEAAERDLLSFCERLLAEEAVEPA